MRKTRKLCKCGRGDILCGNEAAYNAKNSQGESVCPQCKVDEIYESITNSKASSSSEE